MSNIYNLEPPTKGKVVIHTNYGDIDIELWAKEAPLACKNFVQLSLEGYYDNTLVHRVIRDFMIQMGDPSGMGEGGESVYGEPYRDEIHQRLRFTHRGIVAMANENKPNTNTSQFFITLGACDHLKGKHTIFGKVTGNTIFNVTRIGEADTGPDDRPVSPIKVTSIEVLYNPFDDIVPRDMSFQKRREKKETDEEAEAKRREEKRKARLERAAKKDLKLLSFGDEEEEEEQAVPVKRSGLKSVHDVVKDDPTLDATVDQELLKAASADDGHDKKKRDATAQLKRSVGEIEQGKAKPSRGTDLDGGPVIKLGGADAEAEAFAERMRMQLQRKRKLAQAAASSKGEELDVGGEEERLRKAEMQKKIQEKTEEYKKLKSEIKNTSRAAVVETGEKAKQRKAEQGYREMLTPLEQRRQKYLERKRQASGNREEDTLAKLKSFRSTLVTKAKEVKKSGVAPKEAEAYHGQVMEKGDSLLLDGVDDAGDDWFVGGLKFKKHIDDQFRGGDGRRADDYIVVQEKTGNPRKRP